jgi:putative flippase GtrA
MNKILNFIVKNKLMCLLILMQYLLTFFNDKLIFSYDKPSFDYLYPYSLNRHEYIIIYIIIKICVLFFLFFLWNQIFKIFRKKTGENKYQLEGFLLVVAVFLILLIFQWPGIFAGDCYHLLEYATHLQLIPWHSIFTSMFYIFSLSIIPFPSGIVIVQIIIFGFLYSHLYNVISLNLKKKKLRFLFLLPLAIPFIMSNMLYPFRTTYYFFVELYYFIYIFLVLKGKTVPKKLNLIVLTILCAFLIKYRAEGVVYLITFPIIFYFMTREIIDIKKYFKYMLFLVLATMLLSIPQKYFFDKYYNKEYLIANFYLPLSDIFNNEKVDEDEINKIINVNDLKSYGGHYFFEHNYPNTNHGTVSSMSDEEQTKFIDNSIKIFIENIDIFIKSKTNTFFQTIGYKSILTDHYRDIYIFENQYKAAEENFIEFAYTTQNKYRIFESMSMSYKCNDIIFAIAMSIIYLLYCLIKKKSLLFILTGTVLAKNAIVFMTAPSPFSPYYLGFYAIFYFTLMYLLIEFIDKLKIKGIVNLKKTFLQAIKFFMVSGIGWLIDFSIYFIITKFLNLEVFIANIISSIPAITFVFIFSTRKIFQNGNSKVDIKIKYVLYIAYQILLLYLISKFGQFLYDKLLGHFYAIHFIYENLKIIIKIFITPFTMVLNYIIMKLIVEKV